MNNHLKKPIIAVTCGDPAGIGPEIALKATEQLKVRTDLQILLIGNPFWLLEVTSRCHLDLYLKSIDIAELSDPLAKGFLPILPVDIPEPSQILLGQPSVASGEAAFKSLELGINLAMDKKIDALATAPLNKKALHLAGFKYTGHTEILAAKTNNNRLVMGFVSFSESDSTTGHRTKLISLVSRHLSLREAITSLSSDKIELAIQRSYEFLKKFLNQEHPRIAVAGLNPHASEDGLFGSEEREIITPAIEKSVSAGISCSGPYAPDTIFARLYKGEFDAVVAMYHDQGLIPVKLAGLGSSVQVTLGLDFIRTSVDHGTAYDIAAKYCADASGMIAAIEFAAMLALINPHSKVGNFL